eukprot:CAMPEP_0176494612 /NCGR_PEP_ID=MMETSP0200_2-20121128/10200_1 /TAXON_ID=947934 /ORGANISM="Chaetoceros sp., Strain GSL56" /LENGTH=676 /DNA_ID=CAMNT_0017892403 /DNA_START=170 /DNA_END=2197 /DNA_ORIENTATION=+
MNERDRHRFTRARSASPLPSQSELVISRKITKLKNGPSPTSVMGHTFDFEDNKTEDEPFDCSLSTRKRASSVGNLERMNGPMIVHQGPSGRLSVQTFTSSSSSFNRQVVARRSPFHNRPPVPNIPPMSPRQTGTYRMKNSAPLSPGERSASKMASNFRQKRLLISNQRHRIVDIREISVETKTARTKTDIIPERGSKDTGSLSGAKSLTAHLERERVNSSSNTGQIRKRHTSGEFPIQAARSHVTPSDEDVDSTKNNMSHYSDFQEECDDAITIDTVSSLNTMQTEDPFQISNYHASSSPKAAFSSRSSPKSKYRQRLEPPTACTSRQDDVHPPMYVKSVKSKVKKSSIATEYENADQVDHEATISLFVDAKNMSSSLSVDRSRSNPSKIIPTNSSMLEETDIVSNKTRRRLLFGNDNDNPEITAQNVQRPSPSPSHQNAAEGVVSSSDGRSATYLRRERLQKLRMARHNTKTKGVGNSRYYHPSKQPKKNDQTDSMMSDNTNDPALKLPKNGAEIIIFKKPHTPPKELERASAETTRNGVMDQDDYDNDIETNLYEFAKKREEEDDRSVMTGKSIQSFHTLKTCFTVKPATKEELKKAIKVKQRRINLIHHALTCTHPRQTDSNDENYVPCPEVKHCHALGVLVRHVQTCTFNDHAADGSLCCEVPGCALYKKVW